MRTCSHYMRLLPGGEAVAMPFTVANWMEVSNGWRQYGDPGKPRAVSRLEALELVNKWNQAANGRFIYWVGV